MAQMRDIRGNPRWVATLYSTVINILKQKYFLVALVDKKTHLQKQSVMPVFCEGHTLDVAPLSEAITTEALQYGMRC